MNIFKKYGRYDTNRILMLLSIVLAIGLVALLKITHYQQDVKAQTLMAEYDKKCAEQRKIEDEAWQQLNYKLLRFERETNAASLQLEKQQIRLDEILKQLSAAASPPGIICWGDGLTEGVGGDGTTYPGVLQELIEGNGLDIPVINAGVLGEKAITIAGRAGAIPTDAESMPSSLSMYRDYMPVIYIGENGGYQDADDLVAQINAIIGTYGNQEQYLVLGFTIGSASSSAGIESAFLEAFGDHYINLREFIGANGMQLVGLEATADDEKAIESGAMPPSLLYDRLHFNSYGYTVMGHAVYERMGILGYY